MTCNASDDDEIAIRRELKTLESRLLYITGRSYDKNMERKFIRHRIANLNYMLQNPGVVID